MSRLFELSNGLIFKTQEGMGRPPSPIFSYEGLTALFVVTTSGLETFIHFASILRPPGEEPRPQVGALFRAFREESLKKPNMFGARTPKPK